MTELKRGFIDGVSQVIHHGEVPHEVAINVLFGQLINFEIDEVINHLSHINSEKIAKFVEYLKDYKFED